MAVSVRNQVPVIKSFDLAPGRILARKYEVVSRLGGGWEGEVYKVRELSTGIERAAKAFYPHRNVKDQASKFYARKLHKLRSCPILIQYHTEETFSCRRVPVRMLVSDFVEGEMLTGFLGRQPGKRLNPFLAVHLLHALAVGVEAIHRQRDYHGDLHSDNIIVRRCGLSFDLKLIDLFHWNGSYKESMREDICDMIRVFYDALGGRKHYAKLPSEVKQICCGLKRTLILRKYPSVARLREHLETMSWS